MTIAAPPRPVRILGRLLFGIIAAGAAQFLGGVLELARLDANERVALLSSPFPYDILRAITDLDTCATMACWVGAVAALSAVLAKFFVFRADARARVVAWTAVVVFLVGQLCLMVQDSSIGVSVYADPENDRVRQDLMNSLLTAPAFLPLLYIAEIAGLALTIWAIFLLRNEDTREFLRRETERGSDPAWDAMMTARRSRSTTR